MEIKKNIFTLTVWFVIFLSFSNKLTYSQLTEDKYNNNYKNIYVIKNRQNTLKPQTDLSKLINKFQAEEENEDIFKQLDLELNADNTEQIKTAEQEKEESAKIFQELILETSTTKSDKKSDKAETIELITDTIAKLILPGKDNMNPPNVLSMISNLLNLQKRLSGQK